MTRTLCLSLGAAVLLGSMGCEDKLNTITFEQFTELQREMAPPEPGPPPADLDTGELRVDRNFPPYQAGRDDVLFVIFTRLELDLPPEVRVLVHSDGTVDLPVVGKVAVEGLTLEQIEDAIHQAYVPSVVRDLSVHATVETYQTTRVMVVGAVLTPGGVSLPRYQRNMLYAVLAAGGVTSEASGQATLERIRRPAEKVTIDLTDPVELEAALALDPLEDGDIIRVEAAFPNTIFVGGLVNAPAAQIYPPGVHVNFLQAIASAGGLRTDVTPKRGLLVRRMPDGRDVRVELDLKRIQRGEDQNFMLAAGDIVWVPETFETDLQDFINRNFFFRAGVSVTYDPIAYENTRRALSISADRNDTSFAESINDAIGFGLQNAFFPTVPE
jgi:polysaccharide export outer membrane protein